MIKEVLLPIFTSGLTFFLGYLTFRVKTKETKVTESTALLSGYNDLVEQLRKENDRLRIVLEIKDKRIYILERKLRENQSPKRTRRQLP